MFKKIITVFRRLKNDKDLATYYIFNEHDYEISPTKVRTSEVSEFQDDAKDAATRSPTRDEFDRHKADEANDKLYHQH